MTRKGNKMPEGRMPVIEVLELRHKGWPKQVRINFREETMEGEEGKHISWAYDCIRVESMAELAQMKLTKEVAQTLAGIESKQAKALECFVPTTKNRNKYAPGTIMTHYDKVDNTKR